MLAIGVQSSHQLAEIGVKVPAIPIKVNPLDIRQGRWQIFGGHGAVQHRHHSLIKLLGIDGLVGAVGRADSTGGNNEHKVI